MHQAINRAFDILEYVGSNGENPSNFSDIVANVGLNAGTCANIIKAMVKRGYLTKLENKKGYMVGQKLYQLTSFHGYKKDLLNVAKPILIKLTEEINENAILGVLKNNERILLFQTQSKQDIQAVSSEDKLAYESSTGRLLIAMLTDVEIEKFVSLYGLPSPSVWKEASTKKGFTKAIVQIREDGFALQESIRNISGISVAVIQDNKVIGAVGIFLPSFRLTAEFKSILLKELHKASNQITFSLI